MKEGIFVDSKDSSESSWPLFIPIAVLVLVMIFTQVVWLLIPIVILLCVFVGNLREEQKMQYEETYVEQRDHKPDTSTSGYTPTHQVTHEKPIYDRRKQKEEGIAFGILIPIAILSWFFFTSGSWVFLIPVFFMVWSFIDSIVKRYRGRSEVHEEIDRGDAKSIPEISHRTGIPEEQVRRHVVREKRSGAADIWFDPTTGQRAEISSVGARPSETQKGCKYCGFALRYEDRFCPYCGAPIMAESRS